MKFAANEVALLPMFLAEPSAMMSASQLVALLVMILLVTTGNILGPLSLVLAYTTIRGRGIVPLTGLVAVVCGVSLLVLITSPATDRIWLLAWLPLVMGGLALLRYYRRSGFREKNAARGEREQVAP